MLTKQMPWYGFWYLMVVWRIAEVNKNQHFLNLDVASGSK